MSLTAIPNVTSGGMAIPLGRNMFFMRGKKHKDGGIVIGDKRKGIEVEDGEVVKLDQHNTKVFSSMPLLNGNSPASLVLNGANPQQVFQAQEKFKDNVGLKDDGTNKYKDGGEDEGYGWVDAAKDVAGFLPFVGTAVDAYDFYKDPSWENAGWLAASALSDLVGARAAVKGARAAVKGARMLGRGARVGAVALGSAPRLAVDAVRATRPKQSIRIAARAARNLNGPALAFETSFNNNFVRNTLARGLAPQLANSGGLLRTGANLVGNGILTMMDPFGTAMQLLQTGRDMQKANSNENTNNNGRKKYAAGGRGHISNRGVNLIGTFEGFMPRIYKDSDGVETIGYGETDRDFINKYRGRQISRAEATQQLRNRAQWFYDQVANKTVGWDKLNQDQRDVLTSYAYNIGVGGYQRHKKLLAAIAAGDYNLAAKNINAGINDARNPGLRKRRLKEQFIFTNGYGGDLFNSYNKIHTNGDTKGFVKPTPVVPTANNLNDGFMTNVVPKPDPMLKDFEDLERLRYMGSRLPQFKAGGKIKNETRTLSPILETQYDVRYKDKNVTYNYFNGDTRGSYYVPAGRTLREVLLDNKKRLDAQAKAKSDREQKEYNKKSWLGKAAYNTANAVGNFLLPDFDRNSTTITKDGHLQHHQATAAQDPMAEAVVASRVMAPAFKLAGKALRPVGRYIAKKATPVINRAAKAVSTRVSNLVKRIPKPLSEPNSLLNRTKTAAKNVATRVSNAVENKLSNAKSALIDFWHNAANKVSRFVNGKDMYGKYRSVGAAGNGNYTRLRPRTNPRVVNAQQATQQVARQSAQSQARQAAAHATRNGNRFIPQSGANNVIQVGRRVPANPSNFTPNIPTVRSRVSGERLNRFLSEKPAIPSTPSTPTTPNVAPLRGRALYAENRANGLARQDFINRFSNGYSNAIQRSTGMVTRSNAIPTEAHITRSVNTYNKLHGTNITPESVMEKIRAKVARKLEATSQAPKSLAERAAERRAAKGAANVGTNTTVTPTSETPVPANPATTTTPAAPTAPVTNTSGVLRRGASWVGDKLSNAGKGYINAWKNKPIKTAVGTLLGGGAAVTGLYSLFAGNSNPDTTPHDAVLVKPSTNNGPAVINTPPNQEVAPTDSTQTPNVTIQAPEDTPQNNNVPNVVVENPNTQNNNTGGNTVGDSNSSETVTPANTNTGNNKSGTSTTSANKQANTNTKPVNNTQHSSNTASTNNTTPTNNNATNNTNTTANTNTKPVITQKPNVNNQSVTPQQSVNIPSVNNVSPNTNTTSTPSNNSKPNNTTNTTVHPEVNNGKPIYEVKSNKPQLNTDNSGDKANPKFIDKLFPNADNKQNANDTNSNTHMPTTQGTNKGIAVGLDGKVRLINTNSDSPYVPINTTTTPIAQRKGKYVNGNPVFNEDKNGNYTFYKDKKGNLIPSKKFKFVNSEYALNPNYYSQENRNELGAASIANDINMQEQMKNAKYRDLDGKVIDANYKPTPVPLNPSKKSLWQKFKELDDGTKSDIVGIGSNVISGVSGYLNNLHMLNSLKAPAAPVLNQAAKLKTTVNINPQLDTIDRGVQSAVRDSNENTASSNVAASRNMAASLYGVASKNQLYGNKENAETELINKDKLNQQEVARANAEAYNNYTNNVINFRNTVADKRAENFNGLLNTLNSGVQDAITKREQRTNFRNSVKASLVSNPDSALLMANAFPKLLPTDFMNELQKRQREIEENKKKALAAQLEMLKAQQGAYDRFRPVTQ
jgi:phage lysozyme|nr:MAG TPA: Lysozyme [Crassvirales sp.]